MQDVQSPPPLTHNERFRLSRYDQLLRHQSGIAGDKKEDPAEKEEQHNGVDPGARREHVKLLALGGIPDTPAWIRPAAYRTLFNLDLPSTLLTQYTAFVEELSSRLDALPPPTHDLGTKELKEDRLLREIERDVARTFGTLAWFSAPPAAGVRQSLDSEDAFWRRLAALDELDKKAVVQKAPLTPEKAMSMQPPSLSLLPPEESEEQDEAVDMPKTPTSPSPSFLNGGPFDTSPRPRTRRQALLRPLYVYAVLNPGLAYVQGMNSLIGVLWWIFSSSGSELEAEASAFFALGAILSQLRDLFVASLDGTISPSPASPLLTAIAPSNANTPTGLSATLTRYTSLLNWLDPEVAMSLERKGLDPALYVFRWLTTMFATEFTLPDLVRVWDRVVALYPADSQPREALSPVLGHLIDISLATVLMERSTIVSPYSNFQKTIAVLQDVQIEGEGVDRLLQTAWDIRERRLGTSKRVSVSSEPVNWRAAANKWTSAAKDAAVAASTSSTASSLKQRFWQAASPQRHGRTPSTAAVSEYELDDGASVADSDGGSSVVGSPLFASRGQRLLYGSSALNGDSRPNLSRVLSVDGKVLPPPPDVLEARERTMNVLPPPPSMIDDPNGDSDDNESEDGEEPAPTIQERAATSWGVWKNSLSRLAASDAAASLSKTTTNLSIAAQMSAQSTAESLSRTTAQLGSSDTAAALSKRTTNLSIQAQLFRDQLAEQGPERLARIKENVAVVSGRLLASTGSEGPGGPRRPGSPVAEPFTPPNARWGDSPGTSRRPISPQPFSGPDAFISTSPTASVDMARGGSGGPKPLLLSSSARRASAVDPSMSPSPPGSRRSSFRASSPSPSIPRGPTLYTDAPVAPLGIVRSPSHSRGASLAHPTPTRTFPASSFHLRSASTTSPVAAGLELSEEIPLHSLRLHQDDDVTANKLRRSVQRREPSTEEVPSAVPSASGRGWTLSDAPVKKPQPSPLDTASLQPPPQSSVFSSPVTTDDIRPPYFASPSHSEAGDSVEDAPGLPSAAPTTPLEDFAPIPETQEIPLSQLSQSVSARPPRTSSVNPNLASEVAPASSPELSTSRIRRAPAVQGRRKLGRSGGSQSSISSLSELEGEKRRSATAFLAGEMDDARSVASSGSQKRRESRLARGETMPAPATQSTQSEDNSIWDEATEILNAYGD